MAAAWDGSTSSPVMSFRTPCRYFAEGRCCNGDACTFIHDGVPTQKMLAEADVRYMEGRLLHWVAEAAFMGDSIEVVEWLVDGCCDIGALSDHGITLLMLASAYGHEELLEELLARGAVVNQTARRGATALMYAAFHGQISIVRRLLAAGALPEMVNADGNTAESLADGLGQADCVHPACVHLIKEHQRKAREQAARRRMARHIHDWCAQGNIAMLTAWLENGGSLDLREMEQ